jgi:hypothetical protein
MSQQDLLSRNGKFEKSVHAQIRWNGKDLESSSLDLQLDLEEFKIIGEILKSFKDPFSRFVGEIRKVFRPCHQGAYDSRFVGEIFMVH